MGNEIKQYLGKNAYARLKTQLKNKKRNVDEVSESELFSWKLADDAATEEMKSMKALYQQKSGDYSY